MSDLVNSTLLGSMQIRTKHLNFSARALKVLTEINVEITIKQIDEFLII